MNPGVVASLALFVLVLALERGVIGGPAAHTLSAVVVLLAGAWTIGRGNAARGLSELYLWLAFIFSVYHLQLLASAAARWVGVPEIEMLRPIAIGHVLAVCAALWILGAWSGDRESGIRWPLDRLAAGLFIVGAVIFWVGARTFPGLALDRIAAEPAGHQWTSGSFLLAAIVTVIAFGVWTQSFREKGDRILSRLGLLVFSLASVFWVLHLAVRMTVMVQAAQAWSAAGSPPDWFEPWRAWAALLFALYSVLAYVGLAAYGGAWLSLGRQPRWAGWTCVLAGLLAAPLGGLPLFVHVPVWIVGILMLTSRASLEPAARFAGDDGARIGRVV
jgi:hypothetical protein